MSALPAEDAIEHLAAGGLVAFPTETTWGLAADAASERAMEALRRFKGRDAAKPVSLLVPEAGALASYAEVGDAARALVDAYWPGPLTLVLAATPVAAQRFASGIAGADGGVGFRCSPHPVAVSLAELARGRGVGPLTATSLNLSGERDCRTRAEAERFVADTGVALVAGADASGLPPSTVIDARGERARILREGAIPRAELVRTLPGELAA